MYSGVIADFVDWCGMNHLHINASKTKELVIDFHRKASHVYPENDAGQSISEAAYLLGFSRTVTSGINREWSKSDIRLSEQQFTL